MKRGFDKNKGQDHLRPGNALEPPRLELEDRDPISRGCYGKWILVNLIILIMIIAKKGDHTITYHKYHHDYCKETCKI